MARAERATWTSYVGFYNTGSDLDTHWTDRNYGTSLRMEHDFRLGTPGERRPSEPGASLTFFFRSTK